MSETHQIRWWVWTLLVAVAISASENIGIIVLFIGLVLWIVHQVAVVKRYSFSMLVGLLASILVIRIGFQMFFGIPVGNQVIFQLPEIELFSAGLRIGGIFTLESLQTAVIEAITLGGIVVALLASAMMIPVSSLLRRLPSGFSHVALVLSIALAFLPQLLNDVKRNLRANRWRGHSKRKVSIIALNLIQVVENALDKSIQLSASMWRRGLGSDTNEHRTNSISLFATLLFLSSVLLSILFGLGVSMIALMMLSSLLLLYAMRGALRQAMLIAQSDFQTSWLILGLIGTSVVILWMTNSVAIEMCVVISIVALSFTLLNTRKREITYALN